MQVFICWSTKRSRRLAETLAGWLPEVCGSDLTCAISTQFEAGGLWYDELVRELDGAGAAILCLTPENLLSPWLHFEAGMVFRSGNDRVLPYFLGAEVGGIGGPLGASQASPATRDGTWRLVQSLIRLGTLDRVATESRFTHRWPALQRQVSTLAAPEFEDVFAGFEGLFERKTFNEPIEDCTDQSWLDRYDGAHATWLLVEQRRELVERCCQPWQLWLYRKLLSQLEGYRRDLRDGLLVQRRFEVTDDGKVDFGRARRPAAPGAAEGLAAACARRCREIRHLEYCLAKPDGAPRLADALAFARMGVDQFADKKRLVQSKGLPVDRAALGIATDAELEGCARSLWDFDRIVYYRVRRDVPGSADAAMNAVEHELDQVDADGPGASRMPLHYAVKAWLSALERLPPPAFDGVHARRVLDGALIFLDRIAKPGDNDPKIRAHLKLIGQIAAE